MATTERALADEAGAYLAAAKEHRRLCQFHRRSLRRCMERVRKLEEKAKRMGLKSFVIISGVEKEE